MADYPCCPAPISRDKKKTLRFGVGVVVTLAVTYYAYQFLSLQFAYSTIKGEWEEAKKTGFKIDVIKESEKRLRECRYHRCSRGPKGPSFLNTGIHRMVKDALKEYGADKTGRVDFALESTGGCVVSTGCTENYEPVPLKTTILGVTICEGPNTPNAMLRASTSPGDCWAFKGSKGTAIIKLLGPVFIDAVSIEHIPRSISPTNEIDSAPKKFSIWGLRDANDKRGRALGQFTYVDSGTPLQTFPIECDKESYEYIEFKVHSNHGNPTFTCVYRLRIHGTLDTIKVDEG